MSDFEKLLKRTKNPTKAQVVKAEAGERAEGVRDALKAGRGNVVAGANKLHYKKDGLKAAERLARKSKPKK